MKNLVTLRQAVEARPFLTERMLRRLVAEKRIPYFKPAGKLVFDLGDIDAWVERGRVEPAAPVRFPRMRRPA